MIETAKACTVAFMKAKISSVVWCAEREKTEDGKHFFFKALANRFWWTSKNCSWFNKAVHDQPSLPNGQHENVVVCY